MTTTIDAAGRVVIPKAMRDALGLSAGTQIEVELKGDTIEVAPKLGEARLERRNGRLVIVSPPGTPPLTVEDVNRHISEARNERIDEFLRLK